MSYKIFIIETFSENNVSIEIDITGCVEDYSEHYEIDDDTAARILLEQYRESATSVDAVLVTRIIH